MFSIEEFRKGMTAFPQSDILIMGYNTTKDYNLKKCQKEINSSSKEQNCLFHMKIAFSNLQFNPQQFISFNYTNPTEPIESRKILCDLFDCLVALKRNRSESDGNSPSD